jgi:hypothetical protein
MMDTRQRTALSSCFIFESQGSLPKTENGLGRSWDGPTITPAPHMNDCNVVFIVAIKQACVNELSGTRRSLKLSKSLVLQIR